MNKIEILFFTDNREGNDLALKAGQMGLSVKVCDFNKVETFFENKSGCCVSVFYMADLKPSDLIRNISHIKSADNIIKLVVADKSDFDGIFFNTINLFNLEFIIKPVDERSFLLLLEKTILVEKYRQIMKLVSDESESRIDLLECMLDVKRKDMFNEGIEKEIFIKILDFEKKMMQEHINLNDSIRNIAINRNQEYAILKDRVKAEEMLGELRREEMINANRIIEAQESLIEYSSRELVEIKKIMDARDSVEELSRVEALDLHAELKKLKEEKRVLEEKIGKLMAGCSGSDKQ